MTVKIIDVPDVLSAVKAVVDEAGHDYKFEGECLYTNVKGEPCCLVARAADKLNLALPAFDTPRNQRRIGVMARHLGWQITDDALALLVEAQARQDGGFLDGDGREAWGDILLALIDKAFMPAEVA